MYLLYAVQKQSKRQAYLVLFDFSLDAEKPSCHIHDYDQETQKNACPSCHFCEKFFLSLSSLLAAKFQEEI